MLKQRIDKFKQNILKTLKNFGFIINMLWKNSPWQCVFIIIIETLSSFIPLAYVYISKKIIDSIGIGLRANYNKKAIIQATTIKNAATIPKHPTGFLVGVVYIG